MHLQTFYEVIRLFKVYLYKHLYLRQTRFFSHICDLLTYIYLFFELTEQIAKTIFTLFFF